MSGTVPELPYDFAHEELHELALTHSSVGLSQDNERLEFLGDAALDLVIAEELYRHHPDLPEGELTELKANVVSRRTLAEAARRLHLEGRARLGPGLRSRALPRSVLANLYEAMLGAVYLDGGLEAARAFTLTTLRGPLERVRARTQHSNPKQRLQQLCQKHWNNLPKYVQLEVRGEAHARAFLVACEVNGTGHPPAWGRTRKEAESWAAHEALLVLEEGEAAA
ncbi:MAG: ribonuclease III [Planctomycetes bacterium]|nr:ribonuclease III [Planctomycetota bacterium]